MPLYFGIPVRLEEAIRILKLEDVTPDICDGEYRALTAANEYLEPISEIQIHYLDKGLCVFGFKIEETGDVWNRYINVDELIQQLTTLKTQFKEEMEHMEVDLSEVTLAHMEEEPEIVNNPLPYVIDWN